MDTGDWRTQLTSDSRSSIVNRITETLKTHLPLSGPEGINDLRGIAARFEDRIFNSAINQTDYLREVCMKMLTVGTKSQNAAGSSSSITAANNILPLDSGEPAVNTVDWRTQLPPDFTPKVCQQDGAASLSSRKPAMYTGDWRTQLTPDVRQRIVNKIMETLKKHYPSSGPEGANHIKIIAARFEEKIFSSAVNQTDYLRKISMKMLTMETKSQNAAGSSSSIPVANNSLPLDAGEPPMNIGDWRMQMPPDSRQKNANKIMETLEKHVPNLGLKGINELMRIAVSFEDLIFNTAIDQVDYFRKISFKMLTVEEGD